MSGENGCIRTRDRIQWVTTVHRLACVCLYFAATCVHKSTTRIYTEISQPGSVWIWPSVEFVSKANPSYWRFELCTWLCPLTWLLCVPHDAICQRILVDSHKDLVRVEFARRWDEILPRAAFTLCYHTAAYNWWQGRGDVCGYRSLSRKFKVSLYYQGSAPVFFLCLYSTVTVHLSFQSISVHCFKK